MASIDNAVELLQRADGLLDADRVADLDGAGQRLLGLHRLEGLEVLQIRAVERIGAFCLGNNNARQLG